MEFKLWDRNHKNIVKLYRAAIDCFEHSKLNEAHSHSDNAINQLKQNNIWAINSISSKGVIIADLYFIRAKSLELLKPDSIDKFHDIINDYQSSVETFGAIDINDRYYMSSFCLADFCLKHSRRLGNKYLVIAYHQLVKTRDTAEALENKNRMTQAISHLGLCYAAVLVDSSIYDLDKAIECHEYGLNYYDEINEKKGVQNARFSLADCHYQRSSNNGSTIDVEHAIKYLEEMLKSCDKGDTQDIQHASMYLGRIFLHKAKNNRLFNVKHAYKVLKTAQSYIDINHNPITWVRVTLDLIEAFFSNKDHQTALHKAEEVERIYQDHITNIFSILRENCHPEMTFRALSIRKDVGRIFGEYKKGDNYDELLSLSKKIKGDPFYDDVWLDTILSLVGEITDSTNTHEIIHIYKNAITSINEEKLPYQCFDIYVRLGTHYADIKDFKLACDCYKNAMAILYRCKSTQKISDNNALKTMFRSSDHLLMVIPFLVLENDAPLLAVEYLELLRLHPASPMLEELVLIENQVNHMSLMQKHKKIKKAELTLPLEEPGVKKNKIIYNIDDYYNLISQLKQGHQELTENHFIQNLKTYIKDFECWVLIPMTTLHYSRFILIPPNSNPDDIFISDRLSASLLDTFKILVNGDEQGWFEVISNYNPKHTEIIDDAVEQMEDFLWESIGCWVYSTIHNEDPVCLPVQLTVIAQGALANLPLCMASSYTTKYRCLLDSVAISYVPSLYTLYSLCNRLKFWNEQVSLGCFSPSAPVITTKKEELSTVSLECELITSALKKSGNTPQLGQLDVSEIGNICEKSSYWHFSTHGKFNWSSYEKSGIDLSDGGKLLAAYMPMFETKCFLRLAVLSTCQSGLSETLGQELSPESFLTEFLKCGAIGAIGTLWAVPEIAAALVLGRFYHFHLIEGHKPAIALHFAQLWLRDISYDELYVFIDQNFIGNPDCVESAALLIEELKIMEENDGECRTPYGHPLYWASFILVGQ